jgi:hypothetical protein
MSENDRRHRWNRFGKPGATAVTVVLALLAILVYAQISSAAQGDQPTTPASEEDAPTSFEEVAPTNEELLAMPATIERYIAAHTLPASVLAPANLETSTGVASAGIVSPNGVFKYTIDIRNTGDFDIPVELSGGLSPDVTLVNVDCAAVTAYTCGLNDGALAWHGLVKSGDSVAVDIVARLNGDAAPDSTVTNTFNIVSAEQSIERSVDVVVGPQAFSLTQYLPLTALIQPDPGPVNLIAGLPNAANTWTLAWTASLGATGYEIHEANDPSFATPTPYAVGPQTSLNITKTPSPFNVYYYRIRSLVGQKVGPWSNVVSVVGGYRDDFDNPATGWSIRRSTYLEEVKGFYENGRYVMQIQDRYDWGIASPLKPAPRVPYVIDFEARLISLGWAHSGGAVFGGDWNGETCPPGTSFDEWYKHDKCFNHFYNTNGIFYDAIRLLFERVDQLVWCPDCGGSPMKRVGDIPTGGDDYHDIDPDDWNHYRIEVWPDVIKVYAAVRGQTPQLQHEYDDTRWISSPYFGFFSSTDAHPDSTWRFEYIQVMPLD